MKLKSVTVSWKYTIDEGNKKFNVCFPQVTFSDKDVFRRGKWSDGEWLKEALEFFREQRPDVPQSILFKDVAIYRTFDKNTKHAKKETNPVRSGSKPKSKIN